MIKSCVSYENFNLKKTYKIVWIKKYKNIRSWNILKYEYILYIILYNYISINICKCKCKKCK